MMKTFLNHRSKLVHITKRNFSPSGASDAQPISWLKLFGSVMLFNTANYGAACYLNDLSIVDIAWGPMFIVPNAYILYKRWHQRNPLMLATFAMVSLWGLRLGYHIGSRHTKGEDYRYTQMRERWKDYGPVGQTIYAYMWVFGMQGFFSMLVNAPVLHVMRTSTSSTRFGPLAAVGSSIWLAGFLFESIGDKQLQDFRDRVENKGKIIKSGLWRYTRHPNYFGECFLWWGMFAIACSQKGGYKTIYSALFITFLLKYVSGVAMLERKQMQKAEFRLYATETNDFIPWFYREVPQDQREQLLKKYEEDIKNGIPFEQSKIEDMILKM